MESSDRYHLLNSTYTSVLSGRYSSTEMKKIFSNNERYKTWRSLWIYLAKCQKELGIDITDGQIKELEDNKTNFDWKLIENIEKDVKHDVVSHIKAYSILCPKAASIIHLGATSCYVTDNTDLILMKNAIVVIKKKLLLCIVALKEFAENHKSVVTLGYTHLQSAQFTTFGKRAGLWLQDFLVDFNNLERIETEVLKFRGVKGTVGTQASFLELFNGDVNKVNLLDQNVTKMAGFNYSFPLTSQTYPRKTDVEVTGVLSSFAASVNKMCTDIRLLSGFGQLTEGHSKDQVGSSAMPYKRNPMKSERCCSLARHLMTLYSDAINTCSNQWLERSLDDSACRRLYIPESFLTCDSILIVLYNIIKQMVVVHPINNVLINRELPYQLVEPIIIAMVKNGANRQECHEKLRCLSQQLNDQINKENFISLIKSDCYFNPIKEEIPKLIDPERYIGNSVNQIETFISNYVDPLLEKNRKLIENSNIENLSI